MSDNLKKKTLLKGFLFLIIIAVLVILDQWTKQLAVLKLKDSGPFVLIDNVFELTYLENRGAAFGMLQGKRTAFLLLTPVVIIALYIMSLKLSKDKKFIPMIVCFLLIAGGAAGNMIDRYFNGYVVDFLYFSLIDFPVFNTADIFVSCGSVGLILLLLFKYKEEDL